LIQNIGKKRQWDVHPFKPLLKVHELAGAFLRPLSRRLEAEVAVLFPTFRLFYIVGAGNSEQIARRGRRKNAPAVTLARLNGCK
jgi:hypothetical protein